MVEFKIAAKLTNADAVLKFVNNELKTNSMISDSWPYIYMAVEEVFTNIAQYAYPPDQAGEVTIFVLSGGEVMIRFEDSGQPFNPLEKEGPNLDVPLMEREIGGLGIHLVKNLMDKVEYEYTGGKNVLTITKSISTPGGGEEYGHAN